MTPPFRYVVDTNIAIKQFIDDPLTEKVNQLFEHLAKNSLAQFYVPDLFYIECANVLIKYVRASRCSAEQAALNLVDLKALRIHSTPTKLLMIGAIDISAKYDISAYDGSYVALSHQVKAPLLTLDKRLFNSMKDSTFDVRLFTDFSIPPLPSRS
jgi:predicted nucleic acid-binding protein